MATRAGTEAVGEGSRVAQAAAPSEEAHEAAPEAADETDANPATIGGSVAALLIEQTHNAVRAATAIGRVRTPSEVIEAQSDFISGSVQRMGRMNERTLAFVRAGKAASLSLSSSHR